LQGLIGVDLLNLNLASKTNSDFSGKGGTTAANTFTGSITTTVIEVLPNGNLVVAGEKQIGVNQNVDVMRFSGTVDPRLLQPNNIISSVQVANVRVESKGRGAQGEAQTVGWLSRFFLSFNPF
jgi:flagellar L-ring protein precursor FlgH